MDHRINQHVINRCRKPSDADILVPGDTISLIGTTSLRIDYNEIDDNRVTAEEVDILLREGEKLAPVMAKTRILRAYSGVRPLVASDDDPSGRNVSRGIVRLPIWHCLVHKNPLKLPCVKSSPCLPRCAVLRFIVMAIARLPG